MAGCSPALRRQERGSAGAPFFWLSLVPLAWATSLAVALTGSALFALPLAAWACLRLGRRSLVAMLAVTLPLHGFAAVAADIRGPAHFHSHGSAAHSHAHVEHHQHVAADEAIEIGDSKPLASGKVKHSPDSAPTAPGAFHVDSLAIAHPGAKRAPASHFLPLPDRPPRLS